MRNKPTIINSRNKKTFLSCARAHPQRHKNVIQPATPAPAKERAGLGSEVADLCAAAAAPPPLPPPPTREASSSIISTRSPCKKKSIFREFVFIPAILCVSFQPARLLKRKKGKSVNLKNVYLHPQFVYFISTRSPCAVPICGMYHKSMVCTTKHAHITCGTQERREGMVVGGRTAGGEEGGENREIEEEAQTYT